jgi:hypothetical protein
LHVSTFQGQNHTRTENSSETCPRTEVPNDGARETFTETERGTLSEGTHYSKNNRGYQREEERRLVLIKGTRQGDNQKANEHVDGIHNHAIEMLDFDKKGGIHKTGQTTEDDKRSIEKIN